MRQKLMGQVTVGECIGASAVQLISFGAGGCAAG